MPDFSTQFGGAFSLQLGALYTDADRCPVLSAVVLNVMYSVTEYLAPWPSFRDNKIVYCGLGTASLVSKRRLITPPFTCLVEVWMVSLNMNSLHLSGGWTHLDERCTEGFNVHVMNSKLFLNVLRIPCKTKRP